ncbi:MAG: minor capsid protein [Firmicutes bacterium]|nr:minor capsid protein [Bacillota bacterium]
MADKMELLPLPFEEAIQYFRSRILLTKEEFLALENEVRAQAFTVAGITALEILRDIQTALEAAIADGTTLEDFRAQANEILARRGWRGLTPYQADNVFRTNLQTAYNVGRYKQMTDPDVISRRPYWQYDAVNDRRTRPSHRAMDGRVWPANHPIWDTWYPPNGFRCRCSVRSLSQEDVDRMGLTVEAEIPQMVQTRDGISQALLPDPGWGYNPGKAAWQPDLTKFPPDLRAAYERRKKTFKRPLGAV